MAPFQGVVTGSIPVGCIDILSHSNEIKLSIIPYYYLNNVILFILVYANFSAFRIRKKYLRLECEEVLFTYASIV